MHKFKKGDKVRVIAHGKIGWEDDNDDDELSRTEADGLDIGQILIIGAVNSEDDEEYAEDDIFNWDVNIGGRIYHPDHFERAMLTNEERIVKRRKEIANAI